MLPHLLQILKALILSLHDGAHAPKSRTFQLFTTVERVTELHQSNVVLGHVVDEVLGRVGLPQGQLVVVFVVEDVHKVSVERMDVVQFRKLGQYGGQFVVERLLRELNLFGVKLSNSRYLHVLVDDGRRFALRLGENNVDKVLGGRHHRNLLEVVVSHLQDTHGLKLFGDERATVSVEIATCMYRFFFVSFQIMRCNLPRAERNCACADCYKNRMMAALFIKNTQTYIVHNIIILNIL